MSKTSSSVALNISVWVAQLLLLFAFVAVGAMKIAMPRESLVAMGMALATDHLGLLRFIGVVEVLGGLGIVLPTATRIAPKLTPTAAVGLVVVMVLATGYHVVIEGKPSASGSAIVLGLLAAFVLWARSRKIPVTARRIDLRRPASTVDGGCTP